MTNIDWFLFLLFIAACVGLALYRKPITIDESGDEPAELVEDRRWDS